MATVFLGTTDFAATVLGHVAASAAHRPSLVLTRPDRPAGRGRKLTAPPVADAARALGLPLAQPDSVNSDEARAQITAAAPTHVLVCAFGALIKEPLLSEHPILNVHPSLLPRWRGAAPVERAMMAGDAETGVCIMQLTAGLDSGPVCLMERTPIGPQDTYGTLAPRLAELGGELLVKALDTAPPFTEQPEDGVTYAEKITAADRTLDPARPAAELVHVVHALTPHIGARIADASGGFLAVGAAQATDAAGPGPGTLTADDGRLLYGTAQGALELLQVQAPGGRMMAAREYLRGNPRL